MYGTIFPTFAKCRSRVWFYYGSNLHWPKYVVIVWSVFSLTLKEPGGQNPPPPRHFLLYLCRLLFFRAETSWLFSFKPCARFKTFLSLFIKIRSRVMTQRCVIARWVQRKTNFPLKLHTNRVFFFFFFFVFQDTLPLCFIFIYLA